MIKWLFVWTFLFMAMTDASDAEVIIMSSPKADDDYYADQLDNIFDFHVEFAQKIKANGDDYVIFVDPALYDDYTQALGPEGIVRGAMLDIWMRDFTPAVPDSPTLFRYSAAGQGGDQAASDDVQGHFLDRIAQTRLRWRQTDLINDGGNVVDDGFGNLVLSTKFLRDNSLSQEKARSAVLAATRADHVAFIDADELGGLEHGDGVVSFIAENTLMINAYPDDPEYRDLLVDQLKAGLPGVTLHEVENAYGQIKGSHDRRFDSACGLYTNALVTPDTIYLPQFGLPSDKIALKQVRSWTDKKVVPVSSEQVCAMGGGVRCMSWQLRGDNGAALLRHVRASGI